MTRAGVRQPASEGAQADLFGAPAAAAPPKKTRAPQRARAPLANTSALHAAPPKKSTDDPGALLNVRQAASRLGLSKSTLDKMRGAGKGPRFVKSTDRAIRYDPADLDAWIAARRSSR